MKMKVSVFIVVMVLTGIGQYSCEPVEDEGIPFGEEFRVEYGQSVTLEDGIELTFLELKRETRCPEGAVCTWDGEAVISVSMGHEDEIGSVFELSIPGHVDAQSSTGHTYKQHRDYNVSLRQLDPYPLIDHTESKHRYVARVVVEQLNEEELTPD